MYRRLAAPLVAAILLVAAACTGTDRGPGPEPVRIAWRQLNLPVPPGDPGRPSPRAAIRCGGQWYIVGAVAGEGGATRPAAWVSPDGGTWTTLSFEALTYYGKQNILYTVGCRDGQIAAVGARNGGVHGNPRVATWYQLPDGTLREVVADFLLYGGTDAVNVGRIAGGPPGWLIAGNRVSGGAVWMSADAKEFQLVELATALAPGAPLSTASDAVAVGGSWLVVGGELSSAHVGRDPAAWTSPDGRRWTRVPVPGTGEDTIMLRVTGAPDGLLALGVRGETFGGWRERGGNWQAAGRFGTTRGPVAAGVSGLTTVGSRALATTEAADGRHLWVSDTRGDVWTLAAIPIVVPTSADSALNVAASDDTILLVADDGQVSGAWLATAIDGGKPGGTVSAPSTRRSGG